MEPYVGEIRFFSFPKVPQGWLACNGQTLTITQYQALNALLGKQYGGDGLNTFGLPDLRGTVPVHRNPYDKTNNFFPQGKKGGAPNSTLTTANMPVHNHLFYGSGATATTAKPNGNNFAVIPQTAAQPFQYFTGAMTSETTGTAAPITIASAGASAPISNMQPYTVGNFCICYQGVWPQRD